MFKAQDPRDGRTKYFVEKCLPFGASISCSHYQRFSNALKFLLDKRTLRLNGTGKASSNYLDDFLFMAICRWLCNQLVKAFLTLCGELNILVALEKTEWASKIIIFLGILLNGRSMTISVPLDKQEKALKLLNDLTGKKRATVKQLQVLTGYLNFLSKAIVLGRTFTRRMYAKFSNVGALQQKNGKKLSSYHHIKLDSEFRFDCELWQTFLMHSRSLAICRPMTDFSTNHTSRVLNFYSDASASEHLGVGEFLTTSGSLLSGRVATSTSTNLALSIWNCMESQRHY